MVVTEIIPFELDNITRVNDEMVVILNSNHYLSKYLSSYQISHFTKDGLRYNLIDGIELSDPELNFKLYKVPTGVTENELSELKPRSFKYRNKLIYVNELGSTNDINLYIGDTLVATLTEVESKDKLIILTASEFEPQEFHELDDTPHQFDRSYVTEINISSYTELTRDITLGIERPEVSNHIRSISYGVKLPFIPTIVGYEYNLSTSSFDPVTRRFDSPYFPIKRKNPFID